MPNLGNYENEPWSQAPLNWVQRELQEAGRSDDYKSLKDCAKILRTAGRNHKKYWAGKAERNEERIRRLPREAYLVNVGRGSAIDQGALERCMREGHLAGAALDVFELEPIPPGDSIWSCPRLHITPHCSGNITLSHTRRFIVEMFLRDLENYAAGRPLEALVNRQLGY